jgi:putative oxidoreductase
MKQLLSKFNAQGYAVMRILVGFLFLWHGSEKLFGFPSAMPAGVPAFIIYGAGSIEFIGGALIMIGLFTRWAAFIASGQMAFAYWMAHGTKAILPIQNGGELAALYCFIFLFISTQGSGIWSVDALRHRR